MRGFNVPENEATFGALVTAFAKCNRLDRAEEFLELCWKEEVRHREVETGGTRVHRIFSVCVERDASTRRGKCYSRACSEETKIGVKPNVHTFTAFIDGLNYSEFKTPGSLREEKKIIAEMFEVLDVMQAVRVKPTTATFNAILKRVSILFSSNSSLKNKRVYEYARVVDEVFQKMKR